MMRTRILAVSLGIVAALTAAACSSDEPSDGTSGSTGTEVTGSSVAESDSSSTTSTSVAAAEESSTSTTVASTSTTAVAGREVTDPADNVKSGDTGEGVRMIQYTLVANGFELGVDGSFGPVTETAVRDFQKSKGLGVDGIVGPITWAALQAGAGMTTTTVAGASSTTAESTTTT